MTYGPEIEVNGKRPKWLADDGEIRVTNIAGWEDRVTPISNIYWKNVATIRLPADHWANSVIERGYWPWAGGDTAPDDWDGDRRAIILRNGASTINYAISWQHRGDGSDIIGYRKKGVEFGEKKYIKELMEDLPGVEVDFDINRHLEYHDGTPVRIYKKLTAEGIYKVKSEDDGLPIPYKWFRADGSHVSGHCPPLRNFVAEPHSDFMQRRGFEPDFSEDEGHYSDFPDKATLESWIDVWPKGKPTSLGHVSPAVDPRDAEIAALIHDNDRLRSSLTAAEEELEAARAKHPDLVPDPDRALKDEILAFAAAADIGWLVDEIDLSDTDTGVGLLYAWEKRNG